MKRFLSLFVLFAALACPMAAWAQAEPLQSLEPAPAASSEATEDAFAAWFVELRGLPVADGGSLADLKAEKQAFRAAARKAGIQYKERYSYDTLFNGFSLQVSPAGLAKLTRMAEVKNVYPVVELSIPEVYTVAEQPEMSSAVGMTQADIAQNELGLTGRGIRLAIMDTGVDYDHPDLGGCFGPGCRVVGGWDFVGDAYDSGTNPVPVPDAFPDDCNGHGTHVAGIAGANGVIRGVAPEAILLAYRVFGCEGTTSSDIMVVAMERALADGAQVINISIGSAYQWPQYPTAQAATRLVNRGVVVVTSAGNSGANGMYSTSAPGVGDKVIATANFQNTVIKNPAFRVSPDGLLIAYTPANGSPATPFSGSYPLARTGTATSVADACNGATAPAAGSLTGKVALIRRGTCGFHEKVANAQSAGAAGVVIYNNVAGALTPNVAGAVAITIPVVAVSAADGVNLNNRIAAGPVTFEWTSDTVGTPNATGNLIAASSSWGVSPDLTLKPDIGAPGNVIRSTIPLEAGTYANLSGTSMASPHVAGAVALLLEARPNTPPNAVRAILQNSASPRLWSGNPALGFLELTHRQGAGMLQIVNAIRSTANVEPGKLSLGESEAGPVTRTLTVTNSGPAAVTYDLSHRPALATAGTYAISTFNGPATVSWSAPTLTVPAGGTATVDVTISPNAALPDRSLYGGYLVLTPQGGGTALSVPYNGFKGDYQSIQILVPTANGFPWLAKLAAGSFTKQPATGATYTMQGDDIPYFVFHFDHQVRELRVEIIDADTGKSWHRALSQEHMGRNSGAATFFSFGWDGVTAAGGKAYTVPNGRYIARLTVRKPLGDSANPAHTESWDSPVITIARP